jgi:hypothetical protein
MRQPSLWFSTLPFQFSTATRNPRNPFLNFSTSIPQWEYHGDRSAQPIVWADGVVPKDKALAGLLDHPRRLMESRVSREGAKVIIFQKFRPDPGFLDCGGWTPLWISPSTRSIPIPNAVQSEHSRTPSFQKKRLGQLHNLGQGTHGKPLSSFASRLRAFA